MRTETVGQHRLTSLDGKISLSKNGFIQLSITEVSTDQFDEAVTRLQEYYYRWGPSFLADGYFVGYILKGEQ